MKKRRKRKRWMIPAAAGILAAGMMYLPVWWQNLQAEQEKERWIDSYMKREDPAGLEETGLEPEADPEQQERMEPDGDPLQRQFDFEGLQRVNPDIVGWIYLPGTQIDEPVCRGTDNHYYLTHTAGKTENSLGAIFVPPETGEDLTDAHVLFFGHNMRSGQRFGELSSYCQETFARKYPHVYVYTPKGSRCGTVYSVYQTNSDSDAYTIGYQLETDAYTEWQERTAKQSMYDCGRIPDRGKQVFTLSTCTGSGAAKERLVVHFLVTAEK